MLTHMTVQNFALAHRIELDFDTGMTVITGETGAGKSIMLDALGLALGDRADTGAIAAGADKAEVCATFDVTAIGQAQQWLAEREFGEETECILRRVVSRDGRSRGFINGSQVTAKELRDLGDMLIDIHSQHEHQSLMKRETHRRLLDEFGHLGDAASRVAALANEYRQHRTRLEQMASDSEEQQARLQLLQYQVEELTTLAVECGETDALQQEQRRLANAESILTACHSALDACTENENANAADLLSHAITQLQQIDLDQARAIVELLESSRIQLQEAASDISRFENDIELDPARLESVEARLDEIYTAARKHRVEPDELPALLERLTEELDTLGNADEEIERLRGEVDRVSSEYADAAAALTAARTESAANLTELIDGQLEQLGMAGARFEVSLAPREADEPHIAGEEVVEFLISTNPGQPPRSLNRIASGGELSRISLAIQVVTANTSRVPTLVFDEVDVGIGGAVAEVVGTLLRQLGDSAQVVCVTHLPQVAAQGHHHFRVVKHAGDDDAHTEIAALESGEKVEEIARMLGGTRLTEQSMAHASEMFEAAQRG